MAKLIVLAGLLLQSKKLPYYEYNTRFRLIVIVQTTLAIFHNMAAPYYSSATLYTPAQRAISHTTNVAIILKIHTNSAYYISKLFCFLCKITFFYCICNKCIFICDACIYYLNISKSCRYFAFVRSFISR